jgi:hypothetical protein
MDQLPLTGLAFAVEVLQGRLALNIVETPIHDAPHQTFKGVDLRLAAPDTRVCHGSLLAVGDTVPKRFFRPVYSLLIIYGIFLSIKIFLRFPHTEQFRQ